MMSGLALWMRARQPRYLIAAGCLQLMQPWLLQETVVPLPQLLAGSLHDTPLAVLVPVVTVSLLQIAFGSDCREADLCPVVRVWLLDASLVVVVGMLGLTSAVSAYYLLDAVEALRWARNALMYIGLACILRSLVGTQSMMLGVLCLGMASTLFGNSAYGTPAFWALPLHSGGSRPAFAASVVIFLGGATCAALLPPRQSRLLARGWAQLRG